MESDDVARQVALTNVTNASGLNGGLQDPGFFTSVSSNGTADPIIWAISRPATNNNGAPISLYAFNPESGGSTMTQLFATTAGVWPNTGGNADLVPVVANGLVFVASNQQLQIFGLLSGPQVSLTPASINFGTVYLFNSATSQTVTLKNIGTSSLTIDKVSLTLGSGTGYSNFGVLLNSCPSKLAAESSCDIEVSFFANQVGALSATLNIADNAPGSPQQVSLSATAIQPRAAFQPASVNFKTVVVGSNRTQDVTLTNTGGTTLNIASIGVTGTDAGDYVESNACPSSLAPHADCIIAVTFTPSTTGSRSANLTVTDNAKISTQNVALSGEGSN